MSVNVSWTITCADWLEANNEGCSWSCDAHNDGDGFYPDAEWHSFNPGDEVTVNRTGDLGRVVGYGSSSGSVMLVEVSGFTELWAARQLWRAGA